MKKVGEQCIPMEWRRLDDVESRAELQIMSGGLPICWD